MPKEIENQTPETESVSSTTDETEAATEVETSENDNADKFNSDKIIEKLKSRLGKEQSQKNEAFDQLNDLKKEFEKMKQEKSQDKLSAKERNEKALSDKDDKIAQLEAEIKHRDAVAEVDGVFKDSGLDVGPKILDMVTTDNPDDTYSNAQAIIDLINKTREESKKDFLKGTTPKISGVKVPKSEKALSEMSLVEIARLKKTNPEAYQQKARSLGWIR